MTELEQLTSIFFSHDYFTDFKFNGMVTKPTAETTTRMVEQGLLIKPVANGIILFSENLKDAVRTELDFELVLNDPAFFNYSLITRSALDGKLLRFSNYSTQENNLALTETVRRALTTDFSVNALPSVADNKHLFGMINLKIVQGMPAKYNITFHAKATFWHYHIISKDLKPFMECSVINTATGEVFDGPHSEKLANGEDALVFKSPKPIVLSNRKSSHYQLVTGYDKINGNHKKVLATLPIANIIQTVAGSPDNVSEIFINY
ncbi:hypothetical protein [Mucilaginibacter glaciei]|uniref:Uncharacterized protein n=1 Tax=Mucilaginibacter glaciei TaxID=2772109 RepID=A0A926NQ09_9SPHI|nr:hypothetical protein [Mucilaginibacter glaciei]MBD1392555.1 hypothetical protein [Mucilaginibacter glaciei]